MSGKKYFSYIRVSTQRQGQAGTSLAEQQGAIERFAITWGLSIVRRFEERETAAKQGRPVFLDMLKQLKSHQADGVIIHKIDRSARNLKDWADLGVLIDKGVEVHFASESVDLNSRGGRLSADIQAVVASDYIRNLREETKKGIYGRLKQGLFPFQALVGYLDSGPGLPKRIDPTMAPLVRRGFEFYAGGDMGLHSVADALYDMGLRSKQGKRVAVSGIASMLHNPFYMGVIRIAKTGQTFAGVHTPIITRTLYEQVQNVFAGKTARKTSKHFFLYRKTITCLRCHRFMIGEVQKGHIYYRCHKMRCLRRCLREEWITHEFLAGLKTLRLSEGEGEDFRKILEVKLANSAAEAERERAVIRLQQRALLERQSRLVDAYMEGILDKEGYYKKKSTLTAEEVELSTRKAAATRADDELTQEMLNSLELAKSAYLSFKSAPPAEQRELVKILASNLATDGEKLLIKFNSPFDTFERR
ncbi:MAG: recombinase family protein [Pyrinomonadaceae bacterium]